MGQSTVKPPFFMDYCVNGPHCRLPKPLGQLDAVNRPPQFNLHWCLVRRAYRIKLTADGGGKSSRGMARGDAIWSSSAAC
jgi:hypothetical protein